MISKTKIKKEIDLAAVSFDTCWTYLVEIKSKKINFSNITNFQPTLASAIYNLSTLYRKIAQEKKKLIKEKSSFSPDWFAKKMAALTSYQSAINQSIAIGKGIGDAFAWFFYQKSRNYLREHLSQEEIFLSPPGLGGIGELEFAKKITLVHGFFVLHHGTTNILRLGDISLIDLTSWSVAGIGEIKTSPIKSGEIEISLLLSGPGVDLEKIKADVMEQGGRKSPKPFMCGFPDDAKARLKRQVERISNSYQALTAIPEKKLRLESNNSIAALKTAFEISKCGRFHFEKASKGLAIAVYREKKKLLSTKLLKKEVIDFSEKMNGIEDLARALINTAREDNSLVIGSIYYDEKGRAPHLPGMTHFFWWPLDLDVLKSIFFKDSMVITVFNPSHLISAFEAAGYQAEISGDLNWNLYKENKGRKISLEGIPYYRRMIAEYLFTEEGILKIIEQFEENLDNKDFSSSMRIELQINQEL